MEGLFWYVHLVIGSRRGGRTFKVRGAKLWNRIPLDMRMRKKDTAGSFKNALKKIFFSLVLMCIMFSYF